MATTSEANFTTTDGVKLHTKTWQAQGSHKATVIHFHGFSDHVDRYYDFFPTLANHGIEVFAIDQRGWGKSVLKPGDKGNTGGTARIMEDCTEVIRSKLPSSVPIYLMGHSMGGGIVLYYGAHGPKDVLQQLNGIIASSPWVVLNPTTRPWAVTILLGTLVSHVLPNFAIVSKLNPYFMSHDKAPCDDWAADPLCHDTATLQTFASCFARGAELASGKAQISHDVDQVLVFHGTADKVNDYDAAKSYTESLDHPHKTFRSFEDAYHSIYLEPGQKEVLFQEVADFILSGPPAKNGQSKL